MLVAQLRIARHLETDIRSNDMSMLYGSSTCPGILASEFRVVIGCVAFRTELRVVQSRASSKFDKMHALNLNCRGSFDMFRSSDLHNTNSATIQLGVTSFMMTVGMLGSGITVR